MKGAFTVADKLGFERCKNIMLPEGQDLNDYFKNHSRDDFIKLAAQARKFRIPNITSIRETITTFQNDLESKSIREGVKTSWENVNSVVISPAETTNGMNMNKINDKNRKESK